VTWYPDRPAVESIPRGTDRVTITAQRGADVLGVRTVTDRSDLDELARTVDALPLVLPGARNCPADFGLEIVASFSGPPGVPAAVLTSDVTGCSFTSFVIGGKAEPALANGNLTSEEAALLGTTLDALRQEAMRMSQGPPVPAPPPSAPTPLHPAPEPLPPVAGSGSIAGTGYASPQGSA
jgi:hypothetical protein